MKHFTLFLLLLIATFSFAQPVLTSDDFNNPAVVEFTMVPVDYIDLSDELDNNNWDFSALSETGPEQVFSVLDPQDAEGGENFPDADIALSMNTLNLYLGADTHLEEMGYYSTEGGDENPIIRTYENNKAYFNLPLSLGDNGSENFSGTTTLPNDIEEVVSGISTWEVLGFGELTLSSGTFDVLVVHYTETTESFIEVQGIEISSLTETDQYGFYTAGYPLPIASFTSTTTTSMGNSSTSESGSILVGETIAVAEVASPALSFDLFPNPAGEAVNIQLHDITSFVELSVYDLSGKRVLMDGFEANNGIRTLSLSGLEQGIYLVRVQSGDLVRTGRLVIQR